MGLLQQIRHDVKAGLARLRFGTVKAAHRALEETELLNLRLEARKLDRRINDLYRDIGERAVELHERGEPAGNILSDREFSPRHGRKPSSKRNAGGLRPTWKMCCAKTDRDRRSACVWQESTSVR